MGPQSLLGWQLAVDEVEIDVLGRAHSPGNKEDQQAEHDQRTHEGKALPGDNAQLWVAEHDVSKSNHHHDGKHRDNRQYWNACNRNIGRRVPVEFGPAEWEHNRCNTDRQDGDDSGKHAQGEQGEERDRQHRPDQDAQHDDGCHDNRRDRCMSSLADFGELAR